MSIIIFYSPVRYLIKNKIELACVKYITNVHPEPGSNSNFNIKKQ